jgi:hypothetical protein
VGLWSQSEDKKSLAEIYSSALNYYYKSKPVNLVITGTTINRYILETDYEELANLLRKPGVVFNGLIKLDSSWISFLRQADKRKHSLEQYRISELKSPIYSIRLIDADSIKKIRNAGWEKFHQTFGWSDQVEFSGIILNENKAIVEFGRTSEALSGEGMLFFLEKMEENWIVVSYLQTWVS